MASAWVRDDPTDPSVEAIALPEYLWGAPNVAGMELHVLKAT